MNRISHIRLCLCLTMVTHCLRAQAQQKALEGFRTAVDVSLVTSADRRRTKGCSGKGCFVRWTSEACWEAGGVPFGQSFAQNPTGCTFAYGDDSNCPYPDFTQFQVIRSSILPIISGICVCPPGTVYSPQQDTCLPAGHDRGLSNCVEDPNNFIPAKIPQGRNPAAPVNFRCQTYNGKDYIAQCAGSAEPGPGGEGCYLAEEEELGGYVVSGFIMSLEVDPSVYTFRRLACLHGSGGELKLHHCDV